ncbi:hypothetical protein [Hyalangium gracile]|uniref:hypothetical protein n=1 Tax=Hyalangium gracile TaxID=394092 RepID=UPI001CCCC9E8|nr:hypothetical protein [Hyalangium gracile]
MRAIGSASHSRNFRSASLTQRTGAGAQSQRTGQGAGSKRTAAGSPTQGTGSGSPTQGSGTGSAAPKFGSRAERREYLKSLSPNDRVAFHEGRQAARIQKGIADGTLTPEEAKGLQEKQASIAEAKSRAMADGKIDEGEFKELRKMQKEASRDIFEQRHNETEVAPAEGERTSRIEGHQNNLRTRLQAGLNDGSVAGSEASSLMDQQTKIAEALGRAMADGKMDETEYNQLRELQREASRNIFSARHTGGIRG